MALSVEEIHDLAIHHPLPEYDAAMRGIFQTFSTFERHLRWAGELHPVYLRALVAILKPKKVVELGTGEGLSTAFMMSTLPPDSRLITIEIGDKWLKFLGHLLGDDRLKVIHGDDLSLEVLSDPELQGIDLLYVDSDHRHAHVSRELKEYRPRLSPGALIVMDDIHLSLGMEKVWDDLGDRKVDTGSLIHRAGFGLALTSPRNASS